MKQVLFIGEGCHDCHIVEDFIGANNLPIQIVNIEKEPDLVPFEIFIRPALVIDNDLIAYGLDVIEYLKKSQMNSKNE